MKKNLLILLLLVVVLFGAWYVLGGKDKQESGSILLESVVYTCDEGRSISASYYESRDTSEVSAGEMPDPKGSVRISMDGSADITLRQTISASGIRYANEDESLVFWSKGDTALVMRDNEMDLGYTNCVAEN